MFYKLIIYIFLQSWGTFLFSQEFKNFYFGEGTFWIQKWNKGGHFSSNKILIIMDTSSIEEDFYYNSRVAEEFRNSLINNGLECEFVFFGEDINFDGLILKFTKLKAKQTTLYFKGDIPLCNRYEVKQVSLFPLKEKHLIYTIIALSIKDDQKSIKDGAKEFARLIAKSLK